MLMTTLAPRVGVDELVARARAAQRALAGHSQEQADELVAAVAWAGYKRENVERLARLAVEDTGLGRFEDKVAKTRRKTFGTLRDLLDPAAKSVGVIEELPELGLTKIAKPVGVVAGLTPSTHPAATPINKAMMILKGCNAVILAPSPKGARTCALVVELVQRELKKIGAPPDLVQMLAPVSRDLTDELMRRVDLVVGTGSQTNVRAAYSSGTPAIGVGAGNVPSIVDATADLEAAAEMIVRSKTFDHATSCSSENALLVQASVYDEMLQALRRRGGVVLDARQKAQLERAMWPDGHLNPEIVGRPPHRIGQLAGLRLERADTRFFIVEETGVGPHRPFSGEKLSVVLALYRFATLAEAVTLAQAILTYQGAGHSVGIHTKSEAHARRLAHELDVVRVLVNQPHCFNNGGGFDNGLNFTLSMGCGTWGKNSIAENLSYKHFLNVTHLVRPIPAREPSEAQLFGAYLAKHGP
jgi:sulfoacetaldehyde dehydrogenase